jgi:transposase InsO family protein
VRRRRQAQVPQRLREDHARHLAVQAALADRCHGGQQQLACQLHLAPRTLRYWKQRDRAGQLIPAHRGRRPYAIDRALRREVLAFVHEMTGPGIGLPALRAAFPQLPRVVLEELLRRYRRVWRARYRRQGYQLTWHRPGAVWAMDHTQACQLIDGQCAYLLGVRDLASHRQLAWLPVRTERSDETLQGLRELTAEYGPPLVMKSDNGSAFKAEETLVIWEPLQVAPLFSPAGRPRYNGALERSNSTLKTLTDHQAVAAEHPLRWTSEDVARAQELANSLSRPWGHRGPSPDEAWQARTPITAQERALFQERLAVERERANHELGLDPVSELDYALRTRRDRLAIERTLEALGYLTKTPVMRAPRIKRGKQKLGTHHRDHRGPSAAPPSIPSAVATFAAAEISVANLPENEPLTMAQATPRPTPPNTPPRDAWGSEESLGEFSLSEPCVGEPTTSRAIISERALPMARAEDPALAQPRVGDRVPQPRAEGGHKISMKVPALNESASTKADVCYNPGTSSVWHAALRVTSRRITAPVDSA